MSGEELLAVRPALPQVRANKEAMCSACKNDGQQPKRRRKVEGESKEKHECFGCQTIKIAATFPRAQLAQPRADITRQCLKCLQVQRAQMQCGRCLETKAQPEFEPQMVTMPVDGILCCACQEEVRQQKSKQWSGCFKCQACSKIFLFAAAGGGKERGRYCLNCASRASCRRQAAALLPGLPETLRYGQIATFLYSEQIRTDCVCVGQATAPECLSAAEGRPHHAERAQEEARRTRGIARQDAAARALRSSRRRGARSAPVGAQLAKEKFLRETAEGFTERLMPLEPTEPQKTKEYNIKVKEMSEGKAAIDLQVGLWEAKSPQPGLEQVKDQSEKFHKEEASWMLGIELGRGLGRVEK
eukprot:s2508_g2.t1